MITADIFNTCRFVETSHGHGPGMFVYIYTCTEHPRLQVKDVGDKRTKTTTRFYLVDGKEMVDMPSMLAALNKPVVLDALEQEILAKVPTDWTTCEPGTRVTKIEELHSLRCKGLVEWHGGKYRRRPQP